MPMKETYSKVQSTWVFDLFLAKTKNLFFAILPGETQSNHSTAKNTSRKVYHYLESLDYRAENARTRKSVYYKELHYAKSDSE